jgi:hypothetical protein
VKTYQIKFKGIRTNGKYFKKCTATQITQAGGSNTGCPAGSEVGSGLVDNIVGNTSDPSNKAIVCSLNLILYNGGQNVLTLYLTPNGATNPCPAQAQAFSGTFKTKGLFTTLSFDVPPSLLHPLPGLDTAVTRTESKIAKKTVKAKVHGKKRKVGYFESFGGCVKGKRPTTVIFTQEDGTVGKASTTSKCKKK